MTQCTFCEIIAGRSPAQVVHEDDHSLAFMDLLPMTPGHCLLVPKRHIVDVWDLDDDDAAHVMRGVTRISHTVRERLRPAGLNILNNNGKLADQSQFHFHFHIIPRYGNDRLLHPWERRFGKHDELRMLAEILRGERDRPGGD
ncbi:MAG: HIT domain-containing protein [Actinobacteria bacterium]|nr:HIT domain-containing protein [Actinomycetota bacterium]